MNAPAETLIYDVLTQTPRCTGGVIPCDVPAALIDSRDNITGQSESNQPNTIITSPYSDGTPGTYNSAESLNSFSVTTSGGPYFLFGATVRVDASVYCLSAVWSFDDVYVFTADSVSSPALRYC